MNTCLSDEDRVTCNSVYRVSGNFSDKEDKNGIQSR